MMAKFSALEQTMVYAYVPNFISIGLFCRPLETKTRANFTVFWTSAFCGVASGQKSEEQEVS